MKISKHLRVDDEIKFKKFHLNQIKHNKCKKGLYLLCTPNYERYMFEVIKGQHLNDKYKDCYLIGVAQEKEIILDYLTELIDEIYNKKTLRYEQLKV